MMNCFLLVWTNRQKDVRRTQGWTLDKTQYPELNWKCSLIVGRFYSFHIDVHVLCVDITQAAILRFHTRLVKDFNILIFSQPARMGEKKYFCCGFRLFQSDVKLSFYPRKTWKRLSTTEKRKFIFHHSPSISNFPGGNLNKKESRSKN